MLAVDVLANAIRANERNLAAGTLAERYLRALHAGGYLVTKREEPPRRRHTGFDCNNTDSPGGDPSPF
jgi:hypothetical protein